MSWDNSALMIHLGRVRLVQGSILARIEHLGLEHFAAELEEEAFSTAAIEGVVLDRSHIRSSVERRLGMKTAGLIHADKQVDGLIQILIDATRNYSEQLTPAVLKGWQAALFPSGYSNLMKIVTGDWRRTNSPMQIVSGTSRKEIVHFEAPPADRLQKEMSAFLSWFNSPVKNIDGILRAAQAHLYFLTIHPFEDGNGRIARAILDKALAQDDGRKKRFYSMSTGILSEREDYYNILESTQKGCGDITEWLIWFMGCMERALNTANTQIEFAWERAHLWQKLSSINLNTRQKKVINKLSEAGKDGFIGGLNNRKYRNLTKTTRETAKRDLADLLKKGVIKKNPGGGRSTSYSLVW